MILLSENSPMTKFLGEFIWYPRFPISGVIGRSIFVEKMKFFAKFACSFLEKPKE